MTFLIGVTNHLGKPIYLRHYTAEALVDADWLRFKNADSAAFEPYGFGGILPADPGNSSPRIRRFDLSANGFDYVMQQRPLEPDEHLELWMFFVSGLSNKNARGVSQFKFVFDDGAGEQFTWTCAYSVATDRVIVVGTGLSDLRVIPAEPVPPNLREEPSH